MESSTPLTSRAPQLERFRSAPSHTIPVSAFGRAGERHVTGTITRREIDRNRWLTQTPHRFFVAFALLIAPTIYRELTEGSSPESVAVVTVLLVALIGLIFSLRRFIGQRRIAEIEQFADATHIASGFLIGSGPLSVGQTASHVGIYATNHGVVAISERRGERREFEVHRIDLTATPQGRVTGSAFMVGGEQYALRAAHGQIRPANA